MKRRQTSAVRPSLPMSDSQPAPLAAIRRTAIRLAVEHLMLNEEAGAGSASEIVAVARRFAAFLKAGDRNQGDVLCRAEMLARAGGESGVAACVRTAERLLAFVEKGR